MKKTFVAGLVLLGLASVPAHAGEVGLIFDKEIGKAQAVAAGANATPGTAGAAGTYAAVSPTGVGIRAAYTLLDLEVAELGLAFTYHPKVQGDLVFNGTNLGTYSNQYASVGIQADWKFLINLHAGMDMRSEKLVTTVGNVTDSTTTLRPWVNAGIGFSLPTPVVSPFVRLEVAAPMSKTTNNSTSTPDDFRKSMAPSLQVSLYGGIRF